MLNPHASAFNSRSSFHFAPPPPPPPARSPNSSDEDLDFIKVMSPNSVSPPPFANAEEEHARVSQFITNDSNTFKAFMN